MDPEKKKGMIIAIGMGKPKPGGGDEPEEDSDDSGAFDAFAAAAGIPEAKRSSAKDALKSFIKECSYGEDD